ncbi:MAG: biotin--[acetyl-CoA-carboxylase] ligase [Nitriliruptoraceae bacterium]
MSLSAHSAVATAVADGRLIRLHEHHDVVTSTNDVARHRVLAGAPLGLLVTADRQSAGRGRSGRPWTDDVEGPGGPANLAVSLAVPLPPVAATLTPLVAGLAVAAAYAEVGANPRLKWPNDVLLDGRKAAGILVERHRLAGSEVLVIGCGLDLDWRGVVREGEWAGWTSLAESLGRDIDRGAVLAALIVALDRELTELDRPEHVLARYREHCDTIGQEVHVSLPGGSTVSGRAVAVDEDGLLVVDTGRERVALRAGDVTGVGVR